MKNLGANIKRIRKAQNVTLVQLSEKTGLSVSYLSKVERDITDITVVNLNLICDALDVDIADFFSNKYKTENITRSLEREIISEDKHRRVEYLCNPEITSLKFTATILKSNDAKGAPFSHSFDELGIAVEGILDVFVDDKTYILYPGDTIFIKANSIRSIKRHDKTGNCVSYWLHLSH